MRSAVHWALRSVLCISLTVYFKRRPGAVATPKKATRKKVEEEVPPFKISTHFLIPKHELLTKEEASQVLAAYHSSPEQLPYILATDPVAKEIGAKPGDFVRVTRKSDTAGSSVYYRYVVEA